MTDDDIIEKSNLSRQFLFRDWNIGDAKSTVAGAAAMAINPAFKTNLLQVRGPSCFQGDHPANFLRCRCVLGRGVRQLNCTAV